MEPINLISLFGIMLVLAAVPSASVGLVVTRSATHGLRSGVAASMGIVVADLLFVLLAILGMSALAELLGSFFVVIRILAGGYLIWMGIRLLRATVESGVRVSSTAGSGSATSFAAGFFLTLGDVKAIFFYASLFPAFVDLTQLTLVSGTAILFLTAVSVGSVKMMYAVLARSLVRRVHNHRLQQAGRAVAGGLMVGTGLYLVAKP
jgi:threonine/homoserine/homoserine lactone efflux protein